MQTLKRYWKHLLFRGAIISICVASCGTLLNFIVIRSNGGMPVQGLGFVDGRWIPLTSDSNFQYLADILPFNYSIGDLIMYASILIFVLYFIVYLKHEDAKEWKKP